MEPDRDDRLSVLLVEDNPGDARLIEHHLRTDTGPVFDPPELTQVDSLDGAEQRLERERFDLVLLDLGLPGSSGIDTLERLNDRLDGNEWISPHPVIVLTGLSDQETALEAIQAGAQDYLVKDDVDGDTLGRTVRYALERHRQEQELKRQNERLERFASVVSHDLRNPLQTAQMTTELLVESAEEGTAVRDYGEQLQGAHERMEAIIEDVLTLARQGQSVDDPEPVELASVAADCWEVVDATEATLEIEGDRRFGADESRLRQLFENLFRNAVEHGGEDVTVRVEATEDGFAVADDGPGVDAGEEVFEAGYTTAETGTGFGLNIVTDIAEAHGWRLSLGESEAGGAEFEVTVTRSGEQRFS